MTDSTKTGLSKVTASRRPVIDPALSDDLMERVLNGELRQTFQRWYPGLQNEEVELKEAA
jgi:hypothetical protein